MADGMLGVLAPVPSAMPVRRRYPRRGEQTPAGEGSPTPREETGDPMTDKPLHIRDAGPVDPDEWWSPQDADLPVGQKADAGEPEPTPIPARRLLIAGVLIFVFTTVSIVFLPDIVAVLSPMGAMIAFGAIVAAAVVTAAPKRAESERSALDDARPVRCGGPRPVGELSRRMAERKGNDGGCGSGGCGC